MHGVSSKDLGKKQFRAGKAGVAYARPGTSHRFSQFRSLHEALTRDGFQLPPSPRQPLGRLLDQVFPYPLLGHTTMFLPRSAGREQLVVPIQATPAFKTLREYSTV
ncbi:hypothetical protein DYB34_008318 [Aphanomyces astaci]|uniref:Uncharacterized protein n=1 Tax=Aphanomyces astaci TaxID=112090 RepID=A0A418C3P1_APHAT|nr:hypothetical protein DYB34_008318 [Aphanomyces astaci]